MRILAPCALTRAVLIASGNVGKTASLAVSTRPRAREVLAGVLHVSARWRVIVPNNRGVRAPLGWRGTTGTTTLSVVCTTVIAHGQRDGLGQSNHVVIRQGAGVQLHAADHQQVWDMGWGAARQRRRCGEVARRVRREEPTDETKGARGVCRVDSRGSLAIPPKAERERCRGRRRHGVQMRCEEPTVETRGARGVHRVDSRRSLVIPPKAEREQCDMRFAIRLSPEPRRPTRRGHVGFRYEESVDTRTIPVARVGSPREKKEDVHLRP